MKNLTNYSDQFILSLMEDCNINPHKATANVQLSIQPDGSLLECLNIWQELPSQSGWDEIYQLVFSEEIKFLEFCESMRLSAWDARCMIEDYDEVNIAIAEMLDAEYTEWLNDYYSDYDAEMLRDLMWMSEKY